MESNELRIGNYVSEGRVLELRSNACRLSYYERTSLIDYNNLKPIKITEQWLLNIGFERYVWGFVLNDISFKDRLMSGFLILEISNGYRVSIRYVHQLQNLYFALTGKELNYNK